MNQSYQTFNLMNPKNHRPNLKNPKNHHPKNRVEIRRTHIYHQLQPLKSRPKLLSKCPKETFHPTLRIYPAGLENTGGSLPPFKHYLLFPNTALQK